MTADLLITGGRVVDGTGYPSYTADVEVTNGRITRIGKLAGAAAHRVVDADGLVVAPGFIDIHTHYEAQLHFEPLATPSCWHGVTTILTGNCGFTLAPSRPADVPWLVQMLSRVEGMPIESLAAGVDFRGGTVADLLARYDGRLGLNMAVYAGHCSIRRAVMGPAASERAATPAEIDEMCVLLRRALADGAIGFSTSQLDVHADHEGKPVPSNLATPDEIVALARVAGEFSHGAIEILARSGAEGFDEADRRLMLEMCEVSGKPLNVNPLTRFPGCPDAWRWALDFCEQAAALGHRIHPMFSINTKGIHFALESTFVLDEMPTFRRVLTLPVGERLRALRDPSVRAQLHVEFADTPSRSMVFGWDEVFVASVAKPEHEGWVERTVAELAGQAGADGLDWMIDAALAEDLQTVFVWRRRPDPLLTQTIHDLIRHPLTTAGSSDGGAHLLTFCGADYTTRLLTEPVPDVLSLEQAVSRLTMQPAVIHGLWDRGMLRPGNVADIVTFDPTRLSVAPIQLVRDFPEGAGRLVFGSTGYHDTIVNGEVLLDKGRHTGALPGVALRGGR